jgi:uncharacterized protein YndB with AHSA1/START domain
MPTARASRRIAAPVEELWAVVSDPHHLPRWWPRVTRVEDVREAAFTEVMKTKKGKTVRADYELVGLDAAAHTVRWDQRIEGTPFAAALASSETELRLEPAGPEAGAAATDVIIELRQQLSGGRAVKPPAGRWSLGRRNPSWGGRLVRKAAQATIEEALAGLERING